VPQTEVQHDHLELLPPPPAVAEGAATQQCSRSVTGARWGSWTQQGPQLQPVSALAAAGHPVARSLLNGFRCHSPPFTATHRLSLPLTDSHCHSHPLTATHRLSLPLTDSHCHSPPLTATHPLSLPLTPPHCHSPALTATHPLSLPLTGSHCHSLTLTATHTPSLPLTGSRSL
jgi:hypothetical protein